MGPRRRSSLLVALAGLALVVFSWLGPAPAGAQDAPTSTAAPASATTTSVGSDQTLVEAPKPPERRLLTESRRVLAIIGALVAVALALAVLTIRYWRHTRPLPPDHDAPRYGSLLDDLDDDAIFVAEPSRRSVAGADHAAADTDWEPRGTGEHAALGVVRPTIVRPGRAARRAALGRHADA